MFFLSSNKHKILKFQTAILHLSVKLNVNRMVVGTLRGFDQFMNLVIDNTVEVNGNEKTDIGMVVGRTLHSLHTVMAKSITLQVQN